jgi:hypothetical protein
MYCRASGTYLLGRRHYLVINGVLGNGKCFPQFDFWTSGTRSFRGPDRWQLIYHISVRLLCGGETSNRPATRVQ